MSAVCPKTCTGRIAFRRRPWRRESVRAMSATCWGSSVRARGSTSTKTGRARTYITELAEATKLKGLVMTRSYSPTPAASMQRWSPAVPLLTPAAWRAPT